jgi:putative copper resistance protein D
LAVAAVAAFATAAVAFAYGKPSPLPGLPSAGPVTAWGLTLFRLASSLCAASALGNLVAGLFWSPRPSPVADRHLLVATRSAWAWAISALGYWLFATSDLRALPLTKMLNADALVNVGMRTAQGQVVGLVLLAAVATGVCCSLRRSVPALAFALFGLLPPAFVNYGTTSPSHRTSVAAGVFFAVFAALWLGGLAALAVRRESLAKAAESFGRLSLWCLPVVAATAAISAYVRLMPADNGIATPYGRLVELQVVVLVALIMLVFGYRLALHTGETARISRSVARQAAGVGALTGLVAALAGTPVPLALAPDGQTLAEGMLGYRLPSSITLWRLLTDWQPDLFFLPLCGALILGYLWLERRLQHRDGDWPAERTLAWLGGVAALAWGTSGGFGRYGYVIFSVHTLQHVLIGIVAPLLLAAGAPLTLTVRALPRGAEPGPREWLVAGLRSRPMRWATNPWVVLAAWSAGPIALYFTGLYDSTMRSVAASVLTSCYLLISGYLLFWPLAGPDPLPGRRPHPGLRPLIPLAAAVIPVTVGFLLSSSQTKLIAPYWFLGLQQIVRPPRPFGSPSLLADQHVGGVLLAATAGVLLLLVAALQLRRPRPLVLYTDDEEESVELAGASRE